MWICTCDDNSSEGWIMFNSELVQTFQLDSSKNVDGERVWCIYAILMYHTSWVEGYTIYTSTDEHDIKEKLLALQSVLNQ